MSGQPQPQWRLHDVTKLKYFIFKKDGNLGYKFEDGRVLTQREFDQLTNNQDPRTLPRTILPARDNHQPPIYRTKSGLSDDDRNPNRTVSSQPLVGSPPDRHYAHAPQNLSTVPSPHGQGPAYVGRPSGATIQPAGRNSGRYLESAPGPVEHAARNDSQSAGGPSTSRLSELAKHMMVVPAGSYGKLHSFIYEHPGVLDHHEIDGFFAEARSQERFGNQRDALRLIHHGLLLRRCRELGSATFFKQLDDRSSNRLTTFTKGVQDLYATIQEQARASMQRPQNPEDQYQVQGRPLMVQSPVQVGRHNSNQPPQQPRTSNSALSESQRPQEVVSQVQANPEPSRPPQRVQTKDDRGVYLDKDGRPLQIASSRSGADRHKRDTDVEAVTNRVSRIDVEPKSRGAQVPDPRVRHTENTPYDPPNVERLRLAEQSDQLMPLRPSVTRDRNGKITEIMGTDGDTEQLDPRYKKRKDAKNFFERGRVFSLLWHEPAGNMHSNLSNPVQITRGKFGQDIFSHILRMVVVKELHGACLCLPVNTYGGRGVSKSGFSKADREAHAIIYMSDTNPTKLAAETGMTKKPIAVDKSSADQKLDPMSRINFSRVHTVNWNVKVMDVGRVARASLPSLVAYYTSAVV